LQLIERRLELGLHVSSRLRRGGRAWR
jgi:hypothetical protein